MKFKLNLKMFLLGVVLATTTVIFTLNAQVVSAWHTETSANSSCSYNEAVINVSFTNTDVQAMVVKAKDEQTGKIIDLGIVQPGDNVSGKIDTAQSSISDGVVHFLLTWANGNSGNDTISANYSAISCSQPVVIPTPTASPSETPVSVTSSNSSSSEGSIGGGSSTGAPAPAICNGTPPPAPVITGWNYVKGTNEIQFNFVEPGIPASQLDFFSMDYGYTKDDLRFGVPYIPNTSTGMPLGALASGNHVWATVTAHQGNCTATSIEVDPRVK